MPDPQKNTKKNNHLNFTETRIQSLTPGVEFTRSYERYDTEVRGLGIRVSPKDTKTFFWYRWVKDSKGSGPKRITIGRYPDLSVKQARDEASELNVARAKGVLPHKRKSESGEYTVGELLAEYIEQYAKERCVRWRDIDLNVKRWFREWLDTKLSSISHIAVQTKINRIGKERGFHAANRARDDLRAIYNWGIKKHLFGGENPCIGIDKFKVQPRDRFIQPDEFKAFFKALFEEPNETIRDFILLCLYTGQRKSNVMEMRWSQIDFNLGTWLIPRTKNGESFHATLPKEAIVILKYRMKLHKKLKLVDDWVLPGNGATGHLAEPKSGWRRIVQRAGLSDLRIHDLRRSMGSYLAMQNTNSPLIQKALGHKSLQAAALYQRVNVDPVSKAMNAAVEVMRQHGGLGKSEPKRKPVLEKKKH